MKRLLTFFVMLVAALGMYADNPVVVTAGNPVVFNEAVRALVEVDYSKTMVKDQTLEEYLTGRGEDFVRDWPNDKAKALEYFTYRFNKKNKKGMQIAKNLTDAKYKMVIYIDWMDMGNGASGFLPWSGSKAGGVIIKGRCDVIDIKAGQYVCRMTFDEVKGSANPSETTRMGMAYFYLANYMFKLSKDASGSVEYCGEVPHAKPKKKVVVREVEEEPAVAEAKSTPVSKSVAKKAVARKGKGKGAVRKGATGVRKGTTAAAKTASAAAATKASVAKKPRKVKYIEVDEDGNETEIIYVKKGTKIPAEVENVEEKTAPVTRPAKKTARHNTANNGNGKVPQTVLNAVSHLKLKNSVGGDAKCLRHEKSLSVYIDFSHCDIINNNEADFTRYMETQADEKDRDGNFAQKWETSYKPSLTSIFVSNMNKEMGKLPLRGTLQQGNKYTLKVALTKIDDNGNTWGDYLIVETATGKVVHHMQMRSKGGHFGEYIGLFQQGFEEAGKIYGELLADRID